MSYRPLAAMDRDTASEWRAYSRSGLQRRGVEVVASRGYLPTLEELAESQPFTRKLDRAVARGDHAEAERLRTRCRMQLVDESNARGLVAQLLREDAAKESA